MGRRDKYLHAGMAREERCQDVLTFQERADKSEGADPWEHYSGSEDSVEGGGVECREEQKFLEVKGYRRCQGWGLDRWTISLRDLVLWCRLLLSFKSKQTGSNGYPHKGHGPPPHLDERLLRHAKRYCPEPPDSRATRPSLQTRPER